MTYEKAVTYIKKYWDNLLVFSPDDKGVHIGLPHHFIQPNDGAFNDDQFYWDSFFISIGLLTQEKNLNLVKGIIENFHYLQDKYGLIPARNKYYNLGISQPPFLSTLVHVVYELTKDKTWLAEQMPLLERELNEYWMGTVVGFHKLDSGLSRYCDHNITHQTAEHESGWDMTSRFHNECLDYTPIDLNCCLYKYEKDLAEFYTFLGVKKKTQEYELRAQERKIKINELCWNETEGFFFDYNHQRQEQSTFYSLAGFYPLWCGLANEDQAYRMIEHLARFEEKGGLATTQPHDLDSTFKQWDYPNGWANLQWIVIVGLQRYGFTQDAKRLAIKWLDCNTKVFEETGKFWEKYDVVNLAVGKQGRYPTQDGFGWSNAIYLYFYTYYFE